MPLYMECKNGHRYDVDAHDGECPRCKRGEVSRHETTDEHLQRRSLFRILDSISDLLRTGSPRHQTKPGSNNPEPASTGPPVIDGPPTATEAEWEQALPKTIPPGAKKGIAILVIAVVIGAAISGGYLILDSRTEGDTVVNSAKVPVNPTAPNPQFPMPDEDEKLNPNPIPTNTPIPTAITIPTQAPEWLNPSPPLALNEAFSLPEEEALHALKAQSADCRIAMGQFQVGIAGDSFRYEFTVLNESSGPISSLSVFPPLDGSFPFGSLNFLPKTGWSMQLLPLDAPPYNEYRFTTDSDFIQSYGGSKLFSFETPTFPVSGGSVIISLTENEVCSFRGIQVPGN